MDWGLIWIWSRASDWWIGVDLRLIWLLELQIYTQFGMRLKRNRALRSQCAIQSQSATLTGLLLTHYLVNSVLAIESRTPAHSPAAAVAFTVAHLHLQLLLWCCILLPPKWNNICRFGQLHTLTKLSLPLNQSIQTPMIQRRCLSSSCRAEITFVVSP